MVAAVLSSGSGAYTNSLAGFEKEWGRAVPVINMAGANAELPRNTGIIAAFGAKAAMRPYPDGLTLIYWAPAMGGEQTGRAGRVIKINLAPRPDILAARLKEIQPKLKLLRIFFMAEHLTAYIEELRSAFRPLGIAIQAGKLGRREDLPDAMRAMNAKPDALLVLNDPALINAQTFAVLKDYSWANGVPFYAPTSGLVEQGATACVAPSFAELGRAAAQTARKVSAGSPVGEEVYPEVNELTVNLAAAEKAGLVFSEEFLKNARKVSP